MTDCPRYGHAPIKMSPRANGDFFEGPRGKAGEFYWSIVDGRRWLNFMVPGKDQNGNDKAKFCNVPVDGIAPTPWQWDGNEDTPTLSPSVLLHGTWHGYVRNGELVEA